MNKKGEGMTLNEFIKIIIAVICIAFLIYFSTLIYSGFKDKNNIKQADATLKDIIYRIEKMEVGKEASYLYLSPEKYYFLSSYDDNKVDFCSARNCLCLCKDSECKDFGICRSTDKIFLLKSNIEGESLVGKEIDAPVSFIIRNENEFYVLKESS